MNSQIVPFLFPRCIAHRGAPLLAPENTLPALEAAIHTGASYVETDIAITSTGELCLFHDDTLERTTNGSGVFEEQSWSLLSSLDAGSWFDQQYGGVRIPLLSEWLQCSAEHGVGLNLEIKPTRYVKQVVSKTLALIAQYWRDDLPAIILSSKSVDVLQACFDQAPFSARALISSKWDQGGVALLKSLGCVSWHLDECVLTQDRVESILHAGYQVLAFTVNDSERADQLFDWGVSAIFSDNMGLVAQYD